MSLVAAVLLAASAAAFDPITFFEGRTRGTGTLRIVLKDPQAVRVESVGTIAADGSLILRQTIDVAGDRLRKRVWRLVRTGPASYSGRLSDADGPVVISTTSSAIRIRYKTPDGLSVQQWLTPARDGRSIDNRTTFSKLGITVARLTERIEKR